MIKNVKSIQKRVFETKDGRLINTSATQPILIMLVKQPYEFRDCHSRFQDDVQDDQQMISCHIECYRLALKDLLFSVLFKMVTLLYRLYVLFTL